MKLESISRADAQQMWLRAQRLTSREPFGSGVEAVERAIAQLGYLQIDTIHVIERAHHHILWTRIPSYRTPELGIAQSQRKSVFEYWTHALSYIPTEDFAYFVSRMQHHELHPNKWFAGVSAADLKRVLKLIESTGPLTISAIKDDVLVDKDHEWASRKPSKRVLEYLFYCGKLTISARHGMLKQYELTTRHFGWKSVPKAPSTKECLKYILRRALRSQGVVSLGSIAYLDPKVKPQLETLIASEVKAGRLRPVRIEGCAETHWIENNETNFKPDPPSEELVHILSPFDPLVIQRKRLKSFFDYEHRFEAYLPAEKRVFGYFTLPVLVGTQFVALLDLKTDRQQKKLLVQKWIWQKGFRSAVLKKRIEEKLGEFEKFQLGRG